MTAPSGTTHSSRARSKVNRGVTNKDKLDHDIHISTVKFSNVKAVENLEELLHLITNVIKNYSKQSSMLAQMRAGSNTITCNLRNKKVAISLARKVSDAFKKYKPDVVVNKPKSQEYYDITVRFIDSEN
ncbi:MAG: hypothetical protein Q8P90_00260 [bacterium]|nr:hypothetical protein [bacterium]